MILNKVVKLLRTFAVDPSREGGSLQVLGYVRRLLCGWAARSSFLEMHLKFKNIKSRNSVLYISSF